MEYAFLNDDIDLNENNSEVHDWVRFGLRLGVTAALHPFEYAKVLMQLGHEPIPPRADVSLLGRPILIYPNVFQYAAYIRKRDGMLGSYRGLTPKLVSSMVGIIVSDSVADMLGMENSEKRKNKIHELDGEALDRYFKMNLKRDLIVTVSNRIVTHPLHVISIRMMAQFVGGETYYNSIFGSIMEIYRNEGLRGFYSGLVPKMLTDVGVLLCTSVAVYWCNKYIITDKFGRQYCGGFIQFICAHLFYPVQLVGTCMAVTGSRLAVAQPPNMPQYVDWMACVKDLRQRNELNRGSSVFWRHIAVYEKGERRRFQFSQLPILCKFL